MKLKPPEAENKEKKKKAVEPAKPEDKKDAIDVTQEEVPEPISDNLVETAKVFVITDEISYGVANDLFKRIKDMLKAIDAGYVPIEKAQKEVIKITKELKEKAKEPWEGAKKIIEQTIWDYAKKVEDERKKSLAKVNEYVEKAAQGTLTAKEEETIFSGEGGFTPPPDSVKLDKRTFKTTWKARIVDEVKFRKAAVLFPQFAKYLVTDTAALNRDARDKEGKIKVPGVEFYEEDSHGSGSD